MTDVVNTIAALHRPAIRTTQRWEARAYLAQGRSLSRSSPFGKASAGGPTFAVPGSPARHISGRLPVCEDDRRGLMPSRCVQLGWRPSGPAQGARESSSPQPLAGEPSIPAAVRQLSTRPLQGGPPGASIAASCRRSGRNPEWEQSRGVPGFLCPPDRRRADLPALVHFGPRLEVALRRAVSSWPARGSS